MGGLSITLDGEPIDQRIPEKAALLLVYLADTGAPARRSRLAGLLWSDVPEDRARANLRVALTRLRSVLDDVVGADREKVWLTVDPTYDAGAIGAGRSDAIVAVYTGEFLGGVEAQDATVFMDWVDARRESLRTMAMISLSEDLAQARSEGRWNDGAPLAAHMVELEPWNETAHRFLMEAAAARGGRNAALAQYQRCVEALEHSLGLEPDMETKDLAESLRHEDPRVPLEGPGSESRAEIPFDMTPLLGRDDEIARLVPRITEGDYRLLTIVGSGGVGKTRVAAEVARQLERSRPGSVVWATLTSVTTTTEFASTLADLLVPDAVFSKADPLEQLTAAIGGRSLCLVLDNFEQLVDSTTPLILEVLRACPDVTAVVTSRRMLDVAAEDVFVLAGLSTPAQGDDIGQSGSVRLFVDRAYRADKTFALREDNAEDIAELCRLLEGVPLHLELAAARISLLSVRELIDLLRTDTRLPGDGPNDSADRHRTFDAVFEQSWNLLTPQTGRALAKLSVTRGGFLRSAAAAILESDGSEATALARMSLLMEERGGRYRFHELLRQSSESHLSATDRADAEIAHARWYLGQLADAGNRLVSSDALETAGPLLLDIDNIRHGWSLGIEHDLVDVLAGAAEGLTQLFEMAGRAVETEQLMADAATACADGRLTSSHTADEAFFVRHQARQRAEWSMDDTTSALCRQVEKLLEDRADRALDRAWAQLHHAQATYHHGDVSAALELLEASARTGTGVDDVNLRAWSLAQRGRILSATGGFDEAAEAFHEAIAMFEATDNQRGHAQARSYLAVTYAEQNRVWDAFVADRMALELCEATGNRQLLSGRHENLAASYLLLGDYDSARHHTAEALAIYRRNAEFDMESYALAQHGECLLGVGDLKAGEEAMSTGIAMMRDEEFAFGLLYNLPPWIRHLQREGRDAQALLAIEELIDIAVDRGAEHFVLTGRALLARSLGATGSHEQALAAAQEVWGALHVPDPPRLPWTVATLLDLAAVFEGAGQTMWSAAVAEARDTQRETARSIADPSLRRCYLEQHLASVELAGVARRLESAS